MNTKSIPTISIYFCGNEDCAPGHFFGPAVRPHYLLHVILDGKGIYRHKNETYHLKKGDAFLISPLESTYYQADQNNPWKYAWVGFDGEAVGGLIKSTCFENTCIYTCPSGKEPLSSIRGLCNDILKTFRTSGYSPLTLMGLFLQLLGIMGNTETGDSRDFSHECVARARDYMNNNYGYDIRISQIADTIGIDRTYLYRMFMEQEKLSPKQYLLQLRIRTAAGMLRDSRYTVTETAYSCGFKDAASFCNQFKKATGVTPSQFRKAR